MLWTVIGFKSKAAFWKEKMVKTEELGCKAYASKQVALWERFAEEAEGQFSQAKDVLLHSHQDWVEAVDM